MPQGSSDESMVAISPAQKRSHSSQASTSETCTTTSPVNKVLKREKAVRGIPFCNDKKQILHQFFKWAYKNHDKADRLIELYYCDFCDEELIMCSRCENKYCTTHHCAEFIYICDECHEYFCESCGLARACIYYDRTHPFRFKSIHLCNNCLPLSDDDSYIVTQF